MAEVFLQETKLEVLHLANFRDKFEVVLIVCRVNSKCNFVRLCHAENLWTSMRGTNLLKMNASQLENRLKLAIAFCCPTEAKLSFQYMVGLL